jgi:hypothetical protein
MIADPSELQAIAATKPTAIAQASKGIASRLDSGNLVAGTPSVAAACGVCFLLQHKMRVSVTVYAQN